MNIENYTNPEKLIKDATFAKRHWSEAHQLRQIKNLIKEYHEGSRLPAVAVLEAIEEVIQY